MEIETKFNIMRTILILSMAICLVALGWQGNNYYRSLQQKTEIMGWWIANDGYNKTEVLEYARSTESYGDWICVNIKGRSIEETQKICEHETGHEIFARYCENNINKCINLTQ